MASIATLLVVAFLCGAALAQNVPPVNWATVGPIHRTPGFFDDYPVLRQIYDRQNPLTSSLEGNSTLRNQFPYQVSQGHHILRDHHNKQEFFLVTFSVM